MTDFNYTDGVAVTGGGLESGLSLGYIELQQAVGRYLGHGATRSSWSSAVDDLINDIVQRGYRQILYPSIPQAAGHKWTFLTVSTTLSVSADDGDYDMPSDFGKIIGEFHYAPDEHKAPIRVIPLSQLYDMRSTSDMNGYANFVAFRWKDSDGSLGQRQEALFYPEFDASYTLYYGYDAYTGALSDASPYPLGGMEMSELYLESCLAVAESERHDELGIHNQVFREMLMEAIARDNKRAAQVYGNMGHSDGLEDVVEWRRGQELHSGAYSIVYDGSQV